MMNPATNFNGNPIANAPVFNNTYAPMVPLADVLGISSNDTKARLWAEYVDRDVIATRAYHPTKIISVPINTEYVVRISKYDNNTWSFSERYAFLDGENKILCCPASIISDVLAMNPKTTIVNLKYKDTTKFFNEPAFVCDTLNESGRTSIMIKKYWWSPLDIKCSMDEYGNKMWTLKDDKTIIGAVNLYTAMIASSKTAGIELPYHMGTDVSPADLAELENKTQYRKYTKDEIYSYLEFLKERNLIPDENPNNNDIEDKAPVSDGAELSEKETDKH